jgi:hypothetical protein
MRKPAKRAQQKAKPAGCDPNSADHSYNALTMQHAMPQPTASPSPWRSMEWSKPPAGKVVLFFVMGRVMAGSMVFNGHGEPHYFAWSDLGSQRLPKEAFSHWRDLPQEKP